MSEQEKKSVSRGKRGFVWSTNIKLRVVAGMARHNFAWFDGKDALQSVPWLQQQQYVIQHKERSDVVLFFGTLGEALAFFEFSDFQSTVSASEKHPMWLLLMHGTSQVKQGKQGTTPKQD